MDICSLWPGHIGCMSSTRPPRPSASNRDAAESRALLKASAERSVSCRLSGSLPILPDEAQMLDQLFGSEIAKLFGE